MLFTNSSFTIPKLLTTPDDFCKRNLSTPRLTPREIDCILDSPYGTNYTYSDSASYKSQKGSWDYTNPRLCRRFPPNSSPPPPPKPQNRMVGTKFGLFLLLALSLVILIGCFNVTEQYGGAFELVSFEEKEEGQQQLQKLEAVNERGILPVGGHFSNRDGGFDLVPFNETEVQRQKEIVTDEHGIEAVPHGHFCEHDGGSDLVPFNETEAQQQMQVKSEPVNERGIQLAHEMCDRRNASNQTSVDGVKKRYYGFVHGVQMGMECGQFQNPIHCVLYMFQCNRRLPLGAWAFLHSNSAISIDLIR